MTTRALVVVGLAVALAAPSSLTSQESLGERLPVARAERRGNEGVAQADVAGALGPVLADPEEEVPFF